MPTVLCISYQYPLCKVLYFPLSMCYVSTPLLLVCQLSGKRNHIFVKELQKHTWYKCCECYMLLWGSCQSYVILEGYCMCGKLRHLVWYNCFPGSEYGDVVRGQSVTINNWNTNVCFANTLFPLEIPYWKLHIRLLISLCLIIIFWYIKYELLHFILLRRSLANLLYNRRNTAYYNL